MCKKKKPKNALVTKVEVSNFKIIEKEEVGWTIEEDWDNTSEEWREEFNFVGVYNNRYE